MKLLSYFKSRQYESLITEQMQQTVHQSVPELSTLSDDSQINLQAINLL